MTKAKALKIVNPILAVLFINQACTGIFHGNLSHEAFEILHEGGGIALIIAGVIHTWLNWNWVAANFFRKRPTPAK